MSRSGMAAVAAEKRPCRSPSGGFACVDRAKSRGEEAKSTRSFRGDPATAPEAEGNQQGRKRGLKALGSCSQHLLCSSGNIAQGFVRELLQCSRPEREFCYAERSLCSACIEDLRQGFQLVNAC